MIRKKHLKIIPFLLVLSFFFIQAKSNQSPVNINKISIQPHKLTTDVVLDTNSPLSIHRSHYSPDNSSTLFIDLSPIKEFPDLPIMPKTSSLVKKIDLEKNRGNNFRLALVLKEPVPYRILSHSQSTVVELNHIQRGAEEYIFGSGLKKELNQTPLSFFHLKGIRVSENENTLNIRAETDGNPISNVFVLENPLRLVVDLFNTLNRRPDTYPVNKYGIKRIRTAQFQVSNPHTISRMVFDLNQPSLFELQEDQNGLTVSFPSSVSSSTSKAAPPPIPKESVIPEKEKDPSKETKNSQKSSHTKTDSSESKTKKDSNISAQKTKSQELQSQEKKSQETQYKPKSITEEEEKYTGEIISLKFKEADLRDVVLYLGEFANLNVVFDPQVSGTVTCDLEDIPWDQALDIILRINNMGKTIEGNVLRIAPVSVLTREQQQERQLKESKELAGPVLVKTFTLSYAKAGEVQGLLQTKMSERGEIIIDERTNTLIISEVRDRMPLLEKLINVFDTATPQVSIEARIVEATSQFIRNLGIQWGFRGIADSFYGNPTSLQFPNSVLVDGAQIPKGTVTKGLGGPLGGYAVNLPAPSFNTAVGLSFGNVLDTFRLDMAITSLERSGEGRIISAPTVTTQNNQEAEIIRGRQIPVQTVANFTVTTRYVNAALELTATPQITAEGTIVMAIDIRNNAADFANLVNGIPPITTQSASTTVMVEDGGTTVIGGIYRMEDTITRERVPFFHKIPILGNLFRSFARTKKNRELLIFITPRIIK
ncbi:type IV pilus secretin PilQ [bacterium]|nr:type IV pilus secretin PilQ [bacterium]